MKTIYIDSDFKCHTSNLDGAYTTVETDFFDGKCKAYIEGYRFVLAGQSWKREDGQVFYGEMIAPWRPYEILVELQAVYEEEQMNTTAEIAALVEEVYNSDTEVIDNV